MSRKRRALRAGMAEAWVVFAERSHPDTLQGDTHAQGDAQWVEMTQFRRSEIAAAFRVPPHMLGDLSRATFSNIEEQGLEVSVSTETSGGEDASTV